MLPDMEVEASKMATSVAAEIGMSPDKIDEVRMAVIEVCINAFEHSHAEDREIVLHVAALGSGEPDTLRVEVRDEGVGFEPNEVEKPSMASKLNSSRKRGWGLTIVRGLMDDVQIRSDTSGTTVVMYKAR